MPHIPLFLERGDVISMFEHLSSHPDTAFLLEADGAQATGKKQWRASGKCAGLDDRCYALWHIPSGPVVVRNDRLGGPDYLPVADPFAGWESVPYANCDEMPYLGSKSQFFELHIRVSAPQPELVGLSGISWIGSRYESAPSSARAFWAQLQRLAKRGARKVRGDGQTSDEGSTFLCWPEAYAKISALNVARART